LKDRIEDLLSEAIPKRQEGGPCLLPGRHLGVPGRSLTIELAGERCGLWKDFATDEG
jgi:hypothetical protein